MDLEKILVTVRNTAQSQETAECRENYLKSCENHGGELAKIAEQVRKELVNFPCNGT
jgi:hypothetical protein